MQPFFADLFERLQDLHRDIAATIAALPQDALVIPTAGGTNAL